MLLIHKETNDKFLMELYTRRENDWISFAKGAYTQQNRSCKKDKIIYLLRDLQDYLACDIKSFGKYSTKTLISVSDDLARIAIWFAQNKRSLEYPIRILSEIFILLLQDYVKLCDDL